MTTTAEATPGAGQRPLFSAAEWTWRVVVWMVLLASLTVLAVAVVIPRLAGATPYTVLTGSMEPTMPPGTLVVVKPKDFDEITSGDVITFQVKSGQPAVATHRVVSVVTSLEGDRRLRTQGDANSVPDAELVREAQVRGAVWYAVPKLGWMSNALDPDTRNSAVYVVAGGLGVYALWMFSGAARGRMRSRRTSGRD